jgi:hypothetical protein
VALHYVLYTLQLQQQLSGAQAAVDYTTAAAAAATTAADGTDGIACVETVIAAAVAALKSKQATLNAQCSKVCDTPLAQTKMSAACTVYAVCCVTATLL